MKRSKQGYVLVLVMVVTLVLCSIASIIAATVSNNLANGVIDFSKKQLDYEVRGLVEKYRWRLSSLAVLSETVPTGGFDPGDLDPTDPEYKTILNEYCNEFIDQRVQDTVNQLRDDFIEHDSGFLDRKSDAEKVSIGGAASLVYQSSYGERMYQVDIYNAEPDHLSPEMLLINVIVNRLYEIDGDLYEEPLLTASFAVRAVWTFDDLDYDEFDESEFVIPEEIQCTINMSVELISYEMK